MGFSMNKAEQHDIVASILGMFPLWFVNYSEIEERSCLIST